MANCRSKSFQRIANGPLPIQTRRQRAGPRQKFKVIAVVKAAQRKVGVPRGNLANNLWATWVQAKGVEVAREQALGTGWQTESRVLQTWQLGLLENSRILHKRCENYLIAIRVCTCVCVCVCAWGRRSSMSPCARNLRAFSQNTPQKPEQTMKLSTASGMAQVAGECRWHR